MSVRFFHFRNKDEEGSPRTRGGFTVAYEFDEGTDSVTRWALTRCSDKENFCRKTGRTVSEGRLRSPKQSFRLASPVSEKAFLASVAQQDVKYLLSRMRG
jgi:hypothetical protein